MLVLVGTRPDDEALSTQLPTLVADPGARRLDLAPLSDRAVTDWVRSALGAEAAEEFCRACHGATSGNPLLMRELIREVSSEHVAPTAEHAARVEALGSHGVSAVVLLRLARLPPGARELARAVAVLGDTANLSLAGALAGLAERRGELRGRGPAACRDPHRRRRPELRAPDRAGGDLREHLRGRSSRHHARAARLLAERRCSPQEIAAQLLETAPDGAGVGGRGAARGGGTRARTGRLEGRGHLPHAERWPSRRPQPPRGGAGRAGPCRGAHRRSRPPSSTSSRRSRSRPMRARRPRRRWSSRAC